VPVVDVESAELPAPAATETGTLAASGNDGATPPDEAAEGSIEAADAEGGDGSGTPRRGWWQRTFGA
jgi:ribonuclease E